MFWILPASGSIKLLIIYEISQVLQYLIVNMKNYFGIKLHEDTDILDVLTTLSHKKSFSFFWSMTACVRNTCQYNYAEK